MVRVGKLVASIKDMQTGIAVGRQKEEGPSRRMHEPSVGRSQGGGQLPLPAFKRATTRHQRTRGQRGGSH